ncbi:zinc finger X-linked protein ZXDB-like [Glossina fuscipes]|uniref:Zinc finger X-linked protein ZXDB-like n=1 Tax=Glossina fuscipes TaxID=7396 RepID=A0A8U0WIP6_9MUSC|nr:zinc finger X-linked protein ZXDB-like [Glossina fuscipes]
MSFFLRNICMFDGCGRLFPNLSDLIRHIENSHINDDPKVVEQLERAQPACLPLSYVLPFMPDGARKETVCPNNNAADADSKPKATNKRRNSVMPSSNRSTTPTGSEMDEDEYVGSESEDSDDSWTTEEFSSTFIMRYGSRYSKSSSNGAFRNEKPFACPVPGCEKRYKNVNGIKYHSKKGHKNNGKVRKRYKCHCGKSYKAAQGLKSHALMIHNSSPKNVLSIPKASGPLEGAVLQRKRSISQSNSLSPSSMSNISSGASSSQGNSGDRRVNTAHVGKHLLQQHVPIRTSVNANTAQQQQYNYAINAPPQQVAGITDVRATTPIQFTLEASSIQSCSSSSFGGQLLTTTVIHHQRLTTIDPNNCFYAAQAPAVQAAPPTIITAAATSTDATSARIYPPTISPTFIEHKYSPNSIKEKMFSNLRQHSCEGNETKNVKPTKTPKGNSNNNCKSNGEDKGSGGKHSDRKVGRRGN